MAGRRFAILIGNGEYREDQPRLTRLRCPSLDVDGMAKVLESEVHGAYLVERLVDETHECVLTKLYDKLRNVAEKGDLVLLYYSGHGKLDVSGDLHLATRNTQVTLLPVSSIPVGRVMEWMRQSRAERIILILDCCFSGAVDRHTKGDISDRIQALTAQMGGLGIHILTASKDTQVAEERPDDQYGLLTKHIIAGIQRGLADRNDDGLVKMQELASYVQERVRVDSRGEQEPLLFTFGGEGGDVVVANTGKPSRRQDVRRWVGPSMASPEAA